MKLNRILIAMGLIAGLGACATESPQQPAEVDATPAREHPITPAQQPLVTSLPARLTAANVVQYMDGLQKEIEQALTGDAGQLFEIERQADHAIKLTASNEASFGFNQSDVNPEFLATLDKLVAPLMKYDQTMVTVLGHTDSTGEDSYNLDLSLRRAEGVSSHLINAGMPTARIATEGRGKAEPRASNATSAGRQLNRRVEIFIRPAVPQ